MTHKTVEEPSIKPVPILDESDIEAPPTPPPGRANPHRRWIAAVGVGLFGAAVIAGAMIVDQPTPVEPTIETAVEDFSPRLARDHLDASDTLVIVASQTDDVWTIEWDPITNPPPDTSGTIGLIPYNRSPVYLPPPFDASFTYRASEDCVGSDCVVRIATSAARLAALVSIEGSEAAWHATEAGLLSWKRGSEVWTGLVEASGTLSDAQPVFEMETEGRVVRFDEAGFLATSSAVRARNLIGEELWIYPGTLIDATTRIVVITDKGNWIIVDRQNGEVLAQLDDTGQVVINEGVAALAGTDPDSAATLVTISLDPIDDSGAPGVISSVPADVDGVLHVYRSTDGSQITFEYVSVESATDVG
ncbi:MAG: hypothetical protein ACR2N2_02720 [Acidimicrobiia bacterium]